MPQHVRDIAVVEGHDPERALALKKHEEGLTKSQDKGAKMRKAEDLEPVACAADAAENICIHCDVETPKRICPDCGKETFPQQMLGGVFDELPVPVKTSNLVPMPSGEENEERYAPRRVADAGPKDAYEKRMLAELKQEHGSKYSDDVLLKSVRTGREPWSIQGGGRANDSRRGSGRGHGGRTRAADSRATLPIQHSGSEPGDHMTRAAHYEIQGDRARALDSYRAAARGYRTAGDMRGLGRANDGVAMCQSKFATQYDHPGKGRVKVCDSADQALRTAIERTRAGEAVRLDGLKVLPDSGRSRAMDAAEGRSWEVAFSDGVTTTVHRGPGELGDCPYRVGQEQQDMRTGAKRKVTAVKEVGAAKDADQPGYKDGDKVEGKEAKLHQLLDKGYSFSDIAAALKVNRSAVEKFAKAHGKDSAFKKLEGKLAHEKGVNDPAALAASIGRKKYGEKGMEAKSAAARDSDLYDATAYRGVELRDYTKTDEAKRFNGKPYVVFAGGRPVGYAKDMAEAKKAADWFLDVKSKGKARDSREVQPV